MAIVNMLPGGGGGLPNDYPPIFFKRSSYIDGNPNFGLGIDEKDSSDCYPIRRTGATTFSYSFATSTTLKNVLNSMLFTITKTVDVYGYVVESSTLVKQKVGTLQPGEYYLDVSRKSSSPYVVYLDIYNNQGTKLFTINRTKSATSTSSSDLTLVNMFFLKEL